MAAVQQFELILRRLRTRLALRRALGWAVRAGWLGAAAVSALLLLGFFAPAASVPAAWLLPVVPAALLAAAGAAWTRRPSLAASAAWVDRACGLEERISTACEVVGCEGAGGAAFARRASAPNEPRPSSLHETLLRDALAALQRADLDRASRLGAPREAPVFVAALAALAILFVVPGRAPAGGVSQAPSRVALREAARHLAGALARPPAVPGIDPIAQAVRQTMEDLKAGAIAAAEARERLRELGRMIETARAAAPAGAEKAKWLDNLLGAVRAAELLAGEAGSGGTASAGLGAGTVEERRRALEEGFRTGFAAAPPKRTVDALADFAAASAPATPSGTGAAAPTGGTAAVDWEKLLAAPRRALAERNWPRWKYDPVIERYFGIEPEQVRQKGR